MNRRSFLKTAALTSLAIAEGRPLLRAAASNNNQWPVAIFEKVFEALNYEELADAIAQIGADGVEATIRPGGHIEPAAAAEEVPKMQASMRARGKRIVIAATHIRSVDELHTESLLRTLKSEGVTHYRMGHYTLDHAKPLLKQVADYAAMAKDLASLNKEIGIQGLYQNHSGARYLGALGWDAALMLKDIDPDALGMAFDTRHLRKDTGSSWTTALAACKPHIRSIYVKDGVWHGERGDQYKDVALDHGFVNQNVFDRIREGLKPMPLCIHMEWLGYRVFEKHEIGDAIAANRQDLITLRRWMER